MAGVGDAGSGKEAPVTPVVHSSGWTFNWWGLVAVLLIVAITFVAWRSLGGSSLSSDDGDPSNRIGASAVSVPTDSVEATAPNTAPTTTRPTPTTVLSSTTTATPDRQVRIRGEMKPCRFGANCLVAGFTIEGFDVHPGRFVCIYPNSRSDFSFNNDGVDDACITADQGDTITIEVDGVRSLTISEQNLDGE